MRPATTAWTGDGSEVLCLAGPTASGKTALALALARHWPMEIVSVDSALVYRGMDIGTAKPTAQERAQVPHHLIDIRDPAQAYSAAEFARDARALIGDIRARGRRVLLVGGTMLYFKALLDGLDDMPTADPSLRAHIDQQARSEGWPALHAQLARVDPLTAARLAPHDAQRIQRALEVWHLSGRPISAWQRRTGGTSQTPILSLEPADRQWLHQRIAQRVDQMFAAGLIDEVRALRARGDLHAGLSSMRCVGYRQVAQWLATAEAGAPDPLSDCRDRCVFATRQLAKRQLTWLRGMTHRTVVACDTPDAVGQALARVEAYWGAPP
jgi:tRNA dimethylallyltransferase